MEIKVVLGILAAIIGGVAYLPYLKDIFALKTKPHAYTWLIWFITNSIALAGVLFGGGSWGSSSLVIFTLLILIVFLYSLKYGSKNITTSDTIILILDFIAVLIWWRLNQPILSILMITAIDVCGYIPSIRKTFVDPWSETPVAWILFAVSNLISILALSKYNLLTTTYLAAIMVANIVMFSISYFRRFYAHRKNNP